MLLATGVIPLGKTRLSEYGFSPSADARTWDTSGHPGPPITPPAPRPPGRRRWSPAGPSRSAHANDGGGSIRIPAAVNGLVGLKPTRGRLAQDRMFRRMPVRLVADGVVTRSVRDTATFLREAEEVYRDLTLAPIGDVTRASRARRRIAVYTDGIDVRATPEVEALTRGTADLFESSGHHVEWIDQPIPASFKDDFLLYWGFLASAIVTSGRLEHGRSWDATRLDRMTLGLDRHCRRNLRRVPRAIARLQALRSARREAARDVRRGPDPDAGARDAAWAGSTRWVSTRR